MNEYTDRGELYEILNDHRNRLGMALLRLQRSTIRPGAAHFQDFRAIQDATMVAQHYRKVIQRA